MKRWFVLVAIFLVLFAPTLSAKESSNTHQTKTAAKSQALQCVAFSPYVGQLNPDYGVHPPKELINELLDKLIQQTPFRCIMTYGVLNGLEEIFPAAEARHLKVIAIIWLDKDINVNTQSINNGIKIAKAFPKTVTKLSCGSELRTRHNMKYDGEIMRCIDKLRQAGVKQPISTIDTWWEWCNREYPCHETSFSAKVDWIGINLFPWWENRFSGLFTCTSADQAADAHVARYDDVQRANPNKEVIITEFGWPNGPVGSTEKNKNTDQHCGIAAKDTQFLVAQSTFKKLAEKNISGVLFEAFSENWKPNNEGSFGSYWGFCEGKPPYSCPHGLELH